MFCSNCGKEIADKAVICVHCGVPVKRIMPYAPAYSAQPKKVNVFGIVGFVLSLLSVSFGFCFFASPVFGAIFSICALLGLVSSIIGMALKKNCNAINGLAVAGLIISILAIVFMGSVMLIIWAIFSAIAV